MGMERVMTHGVRGRGFGPWRGDEGGGHGQCDLQDGEWMKVRGRGVGEGPMGGVEVWLWRGVSKKKSGEGMDYVA